MNAKNSGQERFWEIDFARGIAIILMITLHLFIDLLFLKMFDFKLNWHYWFFWQRITASLFLLLVGISLTLSRFNAEKFGFGKDRRLFKKYLKRGLTTFCMGLMITLITKIYLGEGFIIFGVLHFIGMAIIFGYPFLTLRFWNLILGVTVILIGNHLSNFEFSFPWLLWAGLMPTKFNSVDYFPIFPWFGVVLLGLSLGNILYSKDGRKFKLSDFSNFSLVKSLGYLGKRSLAIYLIHQPVFILLLTIVKFFEK
jgi:uncharacterized membrane protein